MTTLQQHVFRPRGAALELMRHRGGEVLIAGRCTTGMIYECTDSEKHAGVLSAIGRQEPMSFAAGIVSRSIEAGP